MSKFAFDSHFKLFTQDLYNLLGESEYGEEYTKKQKEQVEELVALEKEFRRILQKDCRGATVYKKFIEFIWQSGKDAKRNILIARPYFREREAVFSRDISPAIKSRNYKQLYKLDINYVFISFVLEAVRWGPNSKVNKAAKAVAKKREEIIHHNMPLAITRAKIFRQKTPEDHLSYMDLVQISMQALCNAVDKYVLPYSHVFRSVIIGRIVGDLIYNYSTKMIHFYPSDRRKIYRAIKAKKVTVEDDYEAISNNVNSGPELDSPTNSSEIFSLMMASSHHSLDVPVAEVPGKGSFESDWMSDAHPDDEDKRPDISFERNELREKLYKNIDNLDCLEIKLLKLKGVNYENC